MREDIRIFQKNSNNFKNLKSDAKQLRYAKKLKMHAVSMTHAKYDTACTIDERFEWPWQPLKGISIKNICVFELSYPTTKKYINLKGLTNKRFLSMTPHAQFLRSKIDLISANWNQNSRRLLPVNQGPRRCCLMKKKPRGRKSCGTVPLTPFCIYSLTGQHQPAINNKLLGSCLQQYTELVVLVIFMILHPW
jgi:hypothetical protein